MIAAVRQKLVEMGKTSCENQTLIGQEKGRGVRLTPSVTAEVIKITVDGCLITDSPRCDCLFFYQQPSQRHVFLVELKGNNYSKALSQLAATREHQNYQTLVRTAKQVAVIEQQTLNVAKPFEETAVAVLASKAQTNRPRKDEWEEENDLRLRVERIKDDDTLELRTLIREISS